MHDAVQSPKGKHPNLHIQRIDPESTIIFRAGTSTGRSKAARIFPLLALHDAVLQNNQPNF